MRGQGRVFHPTKTVHGVTHKAATWHIDYSVAGKRHKENAHTRSLRVAQRLLRERAAREAGKLTGNPDAVTLHDLRGLHAQQYALDGRRTGTRIAQHWAHLEAFFHGETRALDLTTPRHDDYAASRLAAGAARQTINNELASLRRAFRLGVEKGLLGSLPVFKLPKVRNQRQGFFAAGEFAALLLHLPPAVEPVVRFLALTGWRVSEALGLTWDSVDWQGQVVRLAPTATKGGEARLFPFGQAPDLKALFDARWAARDGVFVFHRAGKPIRGFRRAWATACKRAGLAGRLVHDLRRTFAREMRRAGVSEGEVMKLAGWRTRSMFDGYNIIDEQDLAAAVAKRYGQLPANSVPPAAPLNPLTSSAATTPL